MPATADQRRRGALRRLVAVSESGCHVWTGYVGSHGYGCYRTVDDNLLAHRMAYELLVGPIPRGHHLHHMCGERRCVNPQHLVVLTMSEHWRIGNSPSAKRKRQTHCQNGHEFTPENTYVRPNGHRRCRRCHAAKEHARRRG